MLLKIINVIKETEITWGGGLAIMDIGLWLCLIIYIFSSVFKIVKEWLI